MTKRMTPLVNPSAIYLALYQRKALRIILITAIVLCGTALPWILVPIDGPRFWDEPYMAMNCALYQRSPLAMWTFYTGHLWTSIFGDGFVSLRFLACLCYSAAAGIGALYCLRRSRDGIYSAMVYTIGSLGCTLTSLPLYGWDSGAYPVTFLVIALVLLYMEKPSRRMALAIGCAGAVMTLSRLPLAAALFIIIPVFIISRRRDTPAPYGATSRDVAIMSCGFILTAAMLMTIMAGSPAGYFKAFAPENIIDGHSPADIDVYIGRIRLLSSWTVRGFMPLSCVILFSCFLARFKQGVSWKVALIAAVLIVFACRQTTFFLSYLGSEIWMAAGLTIPLFFCMVFFGPLYAYYSGNRGYARWELSGVLLAFCLLQALGSDGIPERIGWNTGVVFGCAIFFPAIRRAKAFTFWLIPLALATLCLMTVIRARRVYATYTAPARYSYAEKLNGIRYDPRHKETERTDSLMFLKTQLESRGLKARFMDIEASAYRYCLDDFSPLYSMTFSKEEPTLIREMDALTAAGEVDVIFTLQIRWQTTGDHIRHYTEMGMRPWYGLENGKGTVYAWDSVAAALPADPFAEWGFIPLGQRTAAPE